jgi:site-specific recombinase XerD
MSENSLSVKWIDRPAPSSMLVTARGIEGGISDGERIRRFLSMVHEEDSSSTFRAYVAVLQRLVIWMDMRQIHGLAALTADDIDDFARFMGSPPEEFIGTNRSNLFTASRSPITVKIYMRRINRFLDWCKDHNHIRANPGRSYKKWRKSKKAGGKPAEVKFENQGDRYLKPMMWKAVGAILAEPEMAMPQPTVNDGDPKKAAKEAEQREERVWRQARRRWIVALAYRLGLRREEISTHGMGSFFNDGEYWQFGVLGKGGKAVVLPVSDELLSELRRFRRAVGLSELPADREAGPLVWAKRNNPQKAISPNTIYAILKRLFAEAAAKLEPENPTAARRLRQASPHWLRHTFATHLADQGVSMKARKDLTRHSDVRTLALYEHAGDEETRAAVNHLRTI